MKTEYYYTREVTRMRDTAHAGGLYEVKCLCNAVLGGMPNLLPSEREAALAALRDYFSRIPYYSHTPEQKS